MILTEKLHRISVSSSGRIDKYEYLTGEETLPSNQNQITEKAKFTYSPLGEAFEKQAKTIEGQGKKQADILKTLKPKESQAVEDKSDDNEKHLKYKQVFNELSQEIVGEIYNICKKNYLNSLSYYFKSPNTETINFIDFRGPMHIYTEIENGNISTEIKEDQK